MNRRAWDLASQKYVVERDATFALAQRGTLLPVELDLLGPVLDAGPAVVHLQSGNGTDDFGLVAAGASQVIGADFSAVAASAAAERARSGGVAATYVVGDVHQVPLRDGSADLVYTGKGALMWLTDLGAWATEAARVLRPGGTCFIYEAHPAAALWTRDPDVARLDPLADYFGGTRANTTFPASAIERFGGGAAPPAIEHQWPLSAIVGALLGAGFDLRHLGEHPEPFWRPADEAPVAAWSGALPNAVSILAVRG